MSFAVALLSLEGNYSRLPKLGLGVNQFYS